MSIPVLGACMLHDTTVASLYEKEDLANESQDARNLAARTNRSQDRGTMAPGPVVQHKADLKMYGDDYNREHYASNLHALSGQMTDVSEALGQATEQPMAHALT